MVLRRQTKQRQAILNYLKGVHHHPDAESIFKEVKKTLPHITLATVYRNLHLLAQESLILKLEAQGQYRFDAHTDIHQHGICTQCGKILDFDQEHISRYAMKQLNTKQFIPREVQVIYQGLCKECSHTPLTSNT